MMPDRHADAISLRKVTKTFGAHRALAGVSFDVRRGEMFGLIGPDGAGKTTLIRIICGLVKPDGGEVTVAGHHPVGAHRAITERVGYFSQRFSLYGDLSIDENIAFFAEIHGVTDYGARRERLLDLTRLAAFRGRRADQLSGGMKQKLALACTLVHEPEIILLDEPTTGVDPVSRREFWKLLSEFLASGLTIVMATPYLDEAERCARVALLHEGQLLALDPPDALRQAFTGELWEVLAEPREAAYDALAGVAGVVDRQLFGERMHVRSSGTRAVEESALRAALDSAGVRVISVRRIVPSLEDVFIDRVGGTDVQHEGSPRRFTTKVQHEGSTRRFTT